ncbi:MAG: hypothetical protein IRZ03_08485 [Acidobacterium ailaaui]|nr:hypothetical protein [Pseudacidobacterium ailaaui]
MTLSDLATVADLTARGVDTTDSAKVSAFLAAASAAVREAAGVPITRETYTVTLAGSPDAWLPLPGQPVTSVSDVEIDGTAVTDWKLVGGNLWRCHGWQACHHSPSVVTATITGGLTTVPEDIVDLVCAMVGMALARAEGGDYSSRGDLIQVRIDDYSEGYESSAGSRTAGPMELPELTRRRLRARFGGGVALVRSR